MKVNMNKTKLMISGKSCKAGTEYWQMAILCLW